ncbi:MAG TPA: hypothetical protein PK514_03965 [Spirochaetota bacterium]|nr:hypothetical protein [Spirochaetota bacterium]
MKKIFFYILILSGSLMTACTESSDNNGAGDYINPGFTAKDVLATKNYNIGGFVWNGGTASTGCQAIAYSGKVSGTTYMGFAAKNGTSFNFKIYWPYTSFTSGTPLSITGCTIKLNDETPLTNQTINVTITDESDDTYTLIFNSNITIGSYTISSGNFIRGQLY